jgi:hypothetical protein
MPDDVLVVEDDAIIALDFEDTILDRSPARRWKRRCGGDQAPGDRRFHRAAPTQRSARSVSTPR